MLRRVTSICSIIPLLITFSCNKEEAAKNSTAEISAQKQTESASQSSIQQPVSEENMITTASGLQIIVLQKGSGQEAQMGNIVSVHYTGQFENGTKFDSSVDRGQPFQFTLSKGQVIDGWIEGVSGMRIGEKRKLIIPPHLAYGEQGHPGGIPPNSTLIFEVELLGVK